MIRTIKGVLILHTVFSIVSLRLHISSGVGVLRLGLYTVSCQAKKRWDLYGRIGLDVPYLLCVLCDCAVTGETSASGNIQNRVSRPRGTIHKIDGYAILSCGICEKISLYWLIIQASFFFPSSQCHREDLVGTPVSHARFPCARTFAYCNRHTIHLLTSLK